MPITPTELALVRKLRFDEDIARFIRTQTPTRLQQLAIGKMGGGLKSASGLSIAVKDGKKAEQLMTKIQPRLTKQGYRAFWSNRASPNGLSETDEVTILKTKDHYSIVHLMSTDGANHDISTEDILNRLKAWEKTCTFQIVGASRDWVALQFSRLPEKLCAFAQEIYLFCPDTVSQGTALTRERDDSQKFSAAKKLCPKISIETDQSEKTLAQIGRLAPHLADQFKELLKVSAEHSTPIDMGIRLLAHDLSKTKYLFLWWD